ncbi:hypothetical protein ABFT23_11240 [Nocardioides sp. C4-1]|uniref:hypothetical protein n=1 Tax=Nocardioides sp. C4-1 TaxID=3151851 RepID=UPI003265F9E7
MNDDQLLAELAAAVAEAADVGERRRQAARAAFTWRTVDAELAELLHDSALDAGAAVRSAGSDDEPRSLSFGSGALALEIEYDGTEVVGQVVPSADATLHLQRPEGDEVVVEVDAAGFFRFEGVEPGPTRFVARSADATLTSPWVNL